MTWQEVARAKRESVLAAIPKEWILSSVPTAEEEPNAIPIVDKNLTDKEKSITYSTLLELQSQITSGKLTSLEIAKAFAHRSALLHQLTNCCSEIFFDKAYERAKKLDEYYKETGKTVGPLHGIPLSAKDQLNFEGIDSAMGFVALLNHPKTKEEVSKLVIILEKLGAVFFVKTTTPMAMMAITTTSHIYGETVNVFDRKVSCGGSSGGEGALVGGHGAPLGFGTDIGGSIRVPSALNGLYGLKGSSNRLPYCKLTNSFANQSVLLSVVGPMASNLQDLKYVTKLIIDAEPWKLDPKVPPITWRSVELKKNLVFGIQKSSGTAQSAPPVKRALDLVVEQLEAAGHEVVEWNPPVSTAELAAIAEEVYGADGYKEVEDLCAASGEPVVAEVLAIAGGSSFPTGVSHIHEHWDSARKRYEAQQKVDEYWYNETPKLSKSGEPIDAIIAPVLNNPSFKTKDIGKISCDYTAQYNTLDYTCLVVPVTKVDKTIDGPAINFKPVSDLDQRWHDLYDPELLDGVPVGLQLVGLRYQEEKMIAIGEVLSELLT